MGLRLCSCMHRRAACGLRGASHAVPPAFHATASRSCGRRQSCSVWAACICLRFQLGERKWRMQSVAAHAKSGKEGWRVQVTEDHPDPEDVFLGPEAFRSPDICPPRQEASARAGARFADVTSVFIANKSPCALQLSLQAPTGLLGVTALHELAERRRARARSHTANLSVCWQ